MTDLYKYSYVFLFNAYIAVSFKLLANMNIFLIIVELWPLIHEHKQDAVMSTILCVSLY